MTLPCQSEPIGEESFYIYTLKYKISSYISAKHYDIIPVKACTLSSFTLKRDDFSNYLFKRMVT